MSDEKYSEEAPPPYEHSSSSPPEVISSTDKGTSTLGVKGKFLDFQSSLATLRQTILKNSQDATLQPGFSAIHDACVALCGELDTHARQILQIVSNSNLHHGTSASTMLDEIVSLVNRTQEDLNRSLKDYQACDALIEFESSGKRWLTSCQSTFDLSAGTQSAGPSSSSKGKNRVSFRFLSSLFPRRRTNPPAEVDDWNDYLAESLLKETNEFLEKGNYALAVECARSASEAVQARQSATPSTNRTITYLRARQLECYALYHLGIYSKAHEIGSGVLESEWTKNEQHSESLRCQMILLHITTSLSAAKLPRSFEAVLHARLALTLCDNVRREESGRLGLTSRGFFTLCLAHLEGGLKVDGFVTSPYGVVTNEGPVLTYAHLENANSPPSPKELVFSLHVQSRYKWHSGMLDEAFEQSKKLMTLISDDQFKDPVALNGVHISLPDLLLDHSRMCAELSHWDDAIRYIDKSIDHLIWLHEQNRDSYFFLQQLGNAHVRKASYRRKAHIGPSDMEETLKIAQLGVETLEKSLELTYRLRSGYVATLAYLVLAKMEVSRVARCAKMYGVSYDSLMGTSGMISEIVKLNGAFGQQPRFPSISSILPNSRALLAEIYRDASEDAACQKQWELSIEASRLSCAQYKSLAYSATPTKFLRAGDEDVYLDASRVFAQRLYAGGSKWLRKASAVAMDALKHERLSRRRKWAQGGEWNLALVLSDCIVYLAASGRWATAVELSDELLSFETPIPSEYCRRLHADFLPSLMQVVRCLQDYHDSRAVRLGEICADWARVCSEDEADARSESYHHQSLHARALRAHALCFSHFSKWDECVRTEQASFDLCEQMEKEGVAVYDTQYLQELRQLSEALCAARRPSDAVMLAERGIQVAHGLLKRSSGQQQARVELALCYSTLADSSIHLRDYRKAILAEEMSLEVLQGAGAEQLNLPILADITDSKNITLISAPEAQAMTRGTFATLCADLAKLQDVQSGHTETRSKYGSMVAFLLQACTDVSYPPGSLEYCRIRAAQSPKEHGLDYQKKLESSVKAFSDVRGYEKARMLCEEWVAFTRSQFHESDLGSLLALARALYCYQRILGKLEQYSQAISINHEACEHFISIHKLYPEETYKILDCHRNDAWYNHQLSQELQAHDASVKALDLARSLFKAHDTCRNREALGRSLCDTAGYLTVLDRREEATTVYEEAVSVVRPIDRSPTASEELLIVKCMLAALESLYRQETLDKALTLGQEILETGRSLYTKDPDGCISATLTFLGMCQGDPDKRGESISFLEEALVLSGGMVDESHPILDFLLGYGHASLGINLMAAGERERGMTHCDEVLRLSYRGPGCPGTKSWRRTELVLECLEMIAKFLADDLDLFYEASRFQSRADELRSASGRRRLVMTWTFWED
ncbi:uncharacterized protein EI90DRAFT_3049875 [Cantharellus anzutake]|uniref:uncharacterized protein n=1 Tax=Cantharellus anzutake TaxID=1750568 RepID=UPI001908DEFA|nr:uncharacterized protein EI90DRAFT_3049875 [Cantharellus anzutake]KAF8334698.1 hypothetical protein EI90DRAFT_3049875 [Cantharellus anzutake]